MHFLKKSSRGSGDTMWCVAWRKSGRMRCGLRASHAESCSANTARAVLWIAHVRMFGGQSWGLGPTLGVVMGSSRFVWGYLEKVQSKK